MRVTPLSRPFDLQLALPGSKSQANRALIAACFAEGRTTIHNATPCDDVALMVENLQRLGFAVAFGDRACGRVEIDGGVPVGRGSATLDCGNAGTTLRFLTSVCCVVPGDWTVTGSSRMLDRPIGALVEALRQLGAEIRDCDGYPPLTIRGGSLRGGKVTLDAHASSQFASSLLLVAPAVPDGIDLDIRTPTSRPYLDLTRQVMAEFGIAGPEFPYRSLGEFSIEGDWSAIGAFLVLAELTGSRVEGTNLAEDSTQADRLTPQWIDQLRGSGDRVVDCHDMPDQLMNLAVLAAHRDGETKFVGAGNLRHKECDRLRVLTEQLGKAGVNIEEHDDGVVVRNSTTLQPARLNPHDDHRMVMAFAILGSMYPGIEIENAACVAKSYPAFFSDLATIHREPMCIALIGMRGAGKSTLGKRLAHAFELPFVDTDTRFEVEHGPIAAFVTDRGWDCFRDAEARIAVTAIRPGQVVAMGGGTHLSVATRSRLRDRALVVYVEEDLTTLERRVRTSDRPSLTGRPTVEELGSVLAERVPSYLAAADITIAAGHTLDEQVELVRKEVCSRCSW